MKSNRELEQNKNEERRICVENIQSDHCQLAIRNQRSEKENRQWARKQPKISISLFVFSAQAVCLHIFHIVSYNCISTCNPLYCSRFVILPLLQRICSLFEFNEIQQQNREQNNNKIKTILHQLQIRQHCLSVF